MVHNFYYLVHGRIINENKTKYKKFRFLLFYDTFDLQEYFETDDNKRYGKRIQRLFNIQYGGYN